VRWRQRSRITWLKEGDANTKFFHLRANGRRRKNHIPTLKNATETVSKHEEKADILLQHFTKLMGTNTPASTDLNWESLNLPTAELSHLDAPFLMDELRAAIDGMPGEKAPGPDGFTGEFFKK
jgi:hypothetical protein